MKILGPECELNGKIQEAECHNLHANDLGVQRPSMYSKFSHI